MYFQVYSIGIFHNDSSPTKQELLTIAGNKSQLALQSPDGFGGLDMNLQYILNNLCDSFTFDESSGFEDTQSGEVIDYVLPPSLSPDYYSAEPPPTLGSGKEYNK